MAKSTAKIQADRRSREKAWLQKHWFTSWEAVHTALLQGRYVIAFKSSSQQEKIMTSSPIKKISSVKSEDQKLLDFPEALRAVINGDSITKKEWGDEKIFVFMDSTLKITLQENHYKPSDLIISDGDLLGNDWYIVS